MIRTKVVRIGNSKGIRIPKPLLEHCELNGPVVLEAHGRALVVRSARRPRAGWEESFRRMAQAGDDVLIDRGRWGASRWDTTEWEW